MGIADECGGPRIHVVVQPETELLPEIGRWSSGPKHRERWQVRLYYVNASLVCVLEIAEEKQLVFLDRTAHRKSALPPREERIQIERVSVQTGIRTNVVIAEIEVS